LTDNFRALGCDYLIICKERLIENRGKGLSGLSARRLASEKGNSWELAASVVAGG
jgi:hypothetical protein